MTRGADGDVGECWGIREDAMATEEEMKTPWASYCFFCCSICCLAQSGPSKRSKRAAAVVAVTRLASDKCPPGKTGESLNSFSHVPDCSRECCHLAMCVLSDHVAALVAGTGEDTRSVAASASSPKGWKVSDWTLNAFIWRCMCCLATLPPF